MMVTGVQPVGARGVSGVQATVTDTSRDAALRTRAGGDEERSPEAPRPGDPQPVVFPRSGVGLDQRPVALRNQQAAERYREDGGDDSGGDRDHDGDAGRR